MRCFQDREVGRATEQDATRRAWAPSRQRVDARGRGRQPAAAIACLRTVGVAAAVCVGISRCCVVAIGVRAVGAAVSAGIACC